MSTRPLQTTVSPMKGRPAVLANDSLLLLTSLIWGMAFVAQRLGMEHMGPFTYNAARFALGSLCLLPLLALRRHSTPAVSVPFLPAGMLAGVFLFCGASLQQLGLVFTTAGKAGFITGLYVVLVPLLGLLWGQRAGWGAWSGALLCVAGLFFLSFTQTFGIERGDLLVLLGAFFWAGHVQVLGWLSPRTDPVRLACIQFAICAALSAAAAFALEQPPFSGVLSGAGPVLYGGIMSVGVAFTLQVVAQRKSPPAHAAILLSMESVFAALGGSVVLGERLGTRGVMGCALIFAGMIAAQLPVIVRGAVQGRPAP
ncbi:MAG TPA: DMT family transporter [Spirochaetia bacterium]|nr:DMT family transporter [Spirochaetia bacterium]